MDELEQLQVDVATKVMGWNRVRKDELGRVRGIYPHEPLMGDYTDIADVPDYPRDIAAAWGVVQAVMARHGKVAGRFIVLWHNEPWYKLTAAKAAEKICRAALAAVGDGE